MAQGVGPAQQTTQSQSRSRVKCGHLASLWSAMSRRKPEGEHQTELRRILKLTDLIFLGVGSTLGVGIYVMAAREAHDRAGPAVILSLFVTAVATILAALTFAELASRVSSAGSAYVFSYVACGEFPAYLIGWNLLLEYSIGTAGVARAMVGYVDGLANHTISRFLREIAPINVSFLASYVDLASFGVVTLTFIVLAIGTEVSSWFTNICASVNILNIIVMVVGAAILADFKNWDIPKDQVPPWAGEGGFFPYGLEGVARAAATCFFAYVGFDTIAASGDEAINPRRNIPLSIFITIIIVCIAYTSVAVVITLAVPYYEEDVNTPFPTAFRKAGWMVLRWVVAVGAIFALSTSLIGAAFPMPRILYAMASDGMFFRYFSYVNPKSKVPLYAIGLSWFVTSLTVLVLDLQMLIDLLSIGTLLAYAVVGICVVQIRYRAGEDANENVVREDEQDGKRTWKKTCTAIFNLSRNKTPTNSSNDVVTICQAIFTVAAATMFAILGWVRPLARIPILISIAILAVMMLVVTIIIFLQPQNKPAPSVYKVPLVPFFPYFSILINVYFMVTLDYHTWSRFVVWNAIGLLIYFCYDLRHSTLSENYQRKIAKEEARKEEDQGGKSAEKSVAKP